LKIYAKRKTEIPNRSATGKPLRLESVDRITPGEGSGCWERTETEHENRVL